MVEKRVRMGKKRLRMAERKVRMAEKRIKMTEKGNDRKAKEILHSANAPFRMTTPSVTLTLSRSEGEGSYPFSY